ncbi:hypothetical protein MKW92_011904 [Papaver armeniacum]|nr:hypothetical protein MKW92_011904 [Papaver armeniacum]
MEKPAAERKYHYFNILHEEQEEEQNRGLHLRPINDAFKTYKSNLRLIFCCFDFQRIPCENSRIKEEGSSSQEKFAAARAVPRKVMSFDSPFPTSRWIKKPYVSRISIDYIPVKFAREHLPTKCGEERMDHVLLQNVEGHSWELRASLSGCENYYLHRGWKKFATDNKLNIGDCVLFELIGRLPDATFVMNFHIYRIPVFVEEDLDDE